MALDYQDGLLFTDPERAAKAGREAISPETIWLLNREEIAKRYHIDPVTIEAWPSYERTVALRWLMIDGEVAKRKKRRQR